MELSFWQLGLSGPVPAASPSARHHHESQEEVPQTGQHRSPTLTNVLMAARWHQCHLRPPPFRPRENRLDICLILFNRTQIHQVHGCVARS